MFRPSRRFGPWHRRTALWVLLILGAFVAAIGAFALTSSTVTFSPATYSGTSTHQR
jgi:hypothetical protein